MFDALWYLWKVVVLRRIDGGGGGEVLMKLKSLFIVDKLQDLYEERNLLFDEGNVVLWVGWKVRGRQSRILRKQLAKADGRLVGLSLSICV